MADIYTYSTPLAELFKEYESAAVPEPSGMVSRPASQKEESTEDAYSPLGFLPNFGATVRSFFTEEEAKEVDALPRVADVRTSAIDEVLTEMDMLAYESAMEASAVREDMGVTGLPGSRAPISSLRPPERVGLLASGPVLNSLRPQARPESEDFEIDTTAIEAAVAKIIGGNADRGEPTPVATEEEPPTRVRRGAGLMSPSAEADPEIDTTPAEPPVEAEKVTKNSNLLDFIGKGEGGYDSANRGTIGGDVIGSQMVASRGGKKVSELTVAEIQKYQKITNPNNKDRLFTVGKYQAVPDTFNLAVKGLGLSGDTVFTPEVQERMGMYLVSEKRPKVGKFLRGEGNISVNTAMLELAKEFASIPVPYPIPKGTYGKWPKTDLVAGDSFYKDPKAKRGNKARHTVKATRGVLERARN